jgi:hypothetical protein
MHALALSPAVGLVRPRPTRPDARVVRPFGAWSPVAPSSGSRHVLLKPGGRS